MKKTTFIFAWFVFNLNAAFGNSVASSVANGIVNHNGIAWDSRVPNQGREYALDSARRDSQTGAVMAGITGAALASTATGFFLAGDLATGSALMTMAGLEFAQMAASGRDSNTNRSQRDVLLQQVNSGSQLDLNQEKERLKSELPEGLDDFLSSRGINPDNFKNILFDGNIQSEQAVMDAMGIDSQSISTSELKLGSDKAKSQLDDIFKTAKTSFDNRFGASLGASNSEKNDHKLPNQFTKNESSEKANERKEREVKKANHVTANGNAGLVPASLISSYYGIPESNFTSQELSLLTDGFLREQGILPSRSGRHIFQLANDGYKTFSKTLNSKN